MAFGCKLFSTFFSSHFNDELRSLLLLESSCFTVHIASSLVSTLLESTCFTVHVASSLGSILFGHACFTVHVASSLGHALRFSTLMSKASLCSNGFPPLKFPSISFLFLFSCSLETSIPLVSKTYCALCQLLSFFS